MSETKTVKLAHIVTGLGAVVPYLRPAALDEMAGTPGDELRRGTAELRGFAVEILEVVDLLERYAEGREGS